MGDHHNLFGRTAELAITHKPKGFDMDVLARGETLDRLARLAGYDPEVLKQAFMKLRSRRRRRTEPEPTLEEVTEAFAAFWNMTPYLEGDREAYEELE
jgi:arginine decarboxylase-like protein